MADVPLLPRQANVSEVEELVATVSAKVAGAIGGVAAAEQRIVADRATALLALLRGATIAAHFRRVDAAVARVSNALTAAAVAEVRDWATGYDRIRRTLDDPAAMRRIEELVLEAGPGSGAGWGAARRSSRAWPPLRVRS